MFNQLFTAIRDLFAFFTIGIGACNDLATAGKYQTEIIKDTSAFDVQKKRAKLQQDLDAYQKQLATEPTIKSADLKKAA
jgi:hypothetical protein